MTTPEFARPIPLDRIGGAPSAHRIAADTAECAALAARFGLVAIERLETEAEVSRAGEVVRARGRVSGEAVQSCAATGEPLPVAIDERFDIRFVRETPAREGEEIELGEAECDTMFYEGRAIDLGEAAAESFALALDPFPRAPGADAALRAVGVIGEEEARPMGALAGLKRALEGRGGA